MSSNKPDHVHGQSCRCRTCNSSFLSSPGSDYGTSGTQQQREGATVTLAGQPSQEQINQGNETFRTLPSIAQLQQYGMMWADDPALREAFRRGPTPNQHPYPMALEIDSPNAPASSQQQPNMPTTVGTPAPGQVNGFQRDNPVVPPTNTSGPQPTRDAVIDLPSRSDSGAWTAPPRSISAVDRRDRNSTTSPPAQQMQQGAARSSRPSRQVPPRRSTWETSSGENTPESSS